MSDTGWRDAVARLASDPAFITSLRSDPDGATAGLDLTPGEKDRLLSLATDETVDLGSVPKDDAASSQPEWADGLHLGAAIDSVSGTGQVNDDGWATSTNGTAADGPVTPPVVPPRDPDTTA